MLHTFSTQKWGEYFPDLTQQCAINNLEDGNILYFPSLSFALSPEEQQFLSPDFADPHAKNISYQANCHKLWGFQHLSDTQHTQLKAMLDRFCHSSFDLIKNLLPHYAHQLTIARTSYRPVQISGRKTSYRKDDKRLHVDAFPSAPNQGKRILRVFCNINPNGEDRIWRIGEPFLNVANRFIPQIHKPIPGSAALLRLLKITKSYRTLYDHYMLQMHNLMKADEEYQKAAIQQEIRFPPGSTWIVQTDDVSHAAMQGQYLLEQTFYLPVKAMRDESKSPLCILEKILNQKLV
ncbi:MAG: Kdo hydroxylase family protein [Gammaproteobacteria bacterium]|nr:Kdo hydroxylase family protein [Gammaproteobacteria bacterium]MCW5583606.1 Kdo hydroxylase family protein [Gammaproteobacteria bacterium]